jgi:prophage DNA circulation protein
MPPEKANELFEKLLRTSDNAVRTRERLLSDLREELELLAGLQEQYLLPILRKHGMQDLVQHAINDNQETRALLTELERMPKNNAEFLSKLAEMRRVFQQHIRDDKKDLLPAVLQVLSDADAEAVVKKVEDEMATVEEAKRADARRSREQVETVQRVTEGMADTMKAGVEGAQIMARAMQEAMEGSFGVVSELARRSTDQAMQVVLPNGDNRLAEQTSQNLHAVAQSGTVLARGVQDISREWVELSRKRLQKNLDGLTALARCRSVPDLVAAQASLIRDNLEQTLDNSRRITELTVQVAHEAARTMIVPTETAQRINRVA